jgi:hypothetical protein
LTELANDKYPILKSKLKEIIIDEDLFIYIIGTLLRGQDFLERIVGSLKDMHENILAISLKLDRYLPLLLDDDDNQSILIKL